MTGKQVPNGLLDEIVEKTGKSRREIAYRVQFAEQFPTHDALCKVLHNGPSWRERVPCPDRVPTVSGTRSEWSVSPCPPYRGHGTRDTACEASIRGDRVPPRKVLSPGCFS